MVATTSHPGIGRRVGAVDVVRQALRLVSPRRLLDVGCGGGGLAADLGGRYIAVDMDLDVLSGETDAGDVSTVCADALALPFRSSSVDLVLASGLLHHVSDRCSDHRGCTKTWQVHDVPR